MNLSRAFKGMQNTTGAGTQYSPVVIIIILAGFVLLANLIIMAWFKGDYFMRRGKKPQAAELILIMLVGIIFLPFYLSQRPKGAVVTCFHCDKQKLKEMPVCPHCGKADHEHTSLLKPLQPKS
jgi:hypothetical protein